jgi:hypothetical protein
MIGRQGERGSFMSEHSYAGACLCGAVSYEIVGSARSFFHCHCGRCRKASGTGHASNVILKPSSTAWTSGEESIRRYKVPEAERFGTVFCSICGSPLPRISPDGSYAVIPAGSLDVEPAIEPTDRIFWESRSSWSCDAGTVPAWPTYPVRD